MTCSHEAKALKNEVRAYQAEAGCSEAMAKLLEVVLEDLTCLFLNIDMTASLNLI